MRPARSACVVSRRADLNAALSVLVIVAVPVPAAPLAPMPAAVAVVPMAMVPMAVVPMTVVPMTMAPMAMAPVNVFDQARIPSDAAAARRQRRGGGGRLRAGQDTKHQEACNESCLPHHSVQLLGRIGLAYSAIVPRN